MGWPDAVRNSSAEAVNKSASAMKRRVMLKRTDVGTRGSLVTPRPPATLTAMIREEVGMKGPEMYVEERNGGYYVASTRVSLDSVVCAFLRGQSPESICQSFAPLTLEQVYGAIAFYLANREAID